MRAFMFVCLVSIVSAQYNYEPGIKNDNTSVDSISDDSPISSQPVEEEYNKIFYSYSAPEQEFDDLNAEEHITKALKKNIRVIFIKGPENTAFENAVLQLAKIAADDHTSIYVLSKQSDIGSLANQFQKLKSKNTAKPEVHFVKYRTQADAETAQRAIQAQYDSLPGNSNNSGPSSASVVNFASKTTSNNSHAVSTEAPGTSTTTAHSRNFISRRSYLPQNKRD